MHSSIILRMIFDKIDIRCSKGTLKSILLGAFHFRFAIQFSRCNFIETTMLAHRPLKTEHERHTDRHSAQGSYGLSCP